MYAVKRLNINLVNILLKNNANINDIIINNKNALIISIQKGSIDIACKLINNGFRKTIIDSNGEYIVLKTLMKYININRCLSCLIAIYKNINISKELNKKDIIIELCKCNNPYLIKYRNDIIKTFLDRGIDPNNTDENNKTPCIILCENYSNPFIDIEAENIIETLNLIIKYGADINKQNNNDMQLTKKIIK